MATDFAPGSAKKIPRAKEAPDYRRSPRGGKAVSCEDKSYVNAITTRLPNKLGLSWLRGNGVDPSRPSDRRMLQNFSQEARECYARAEECARKAETALSAQTRTGFLRLERSWVNLARSYESAQQLLASNAEVVRRSAKTH
jgi:hypothetical protein